MCVGEANPNPRGQNSNPTTSEQWSKLRKEGRGCWGRERHEMERPVQRNHLPFLFLLSPFLPAPTLPALLSAHGPSGSVLGRLRSSPLSCPGATPATTKGLR